MKKSLIGWSLFGAASAVAVYVSMPVLNFGFYGLPVVGMVSACVLVLVGFKRGSVALTGIQKAGLGIAGAALLYLTLGQLASTWAFFRADAYRGLLGKVEVGKNFADEIAPISTDKIRIVDQEVAERLGDKVLGEQPSLGSQVRIGRFSIQRVGSTLYWVAPLLHSGFFKWLNSDNGTPGYVMVSAVNERDVRLVQQVNNRPVFIKYQPEAYLGDNLRRYIYFNGYLSDGLTDITFEIDDNGMPYWVATLYRKEVGFAGENARGVLVVNATTGEMKEYDIANAPTWVDRIQPEAFVIDQIDDWGKFVHGWWNPSNEDKIMSDGDATLVYGEDSRSYWYVGLTSVGADEGTVGFMLVDTRTKAAKWYRQTGATEWAAQRSAEGKVQEKGYNASQPVTYNINGVPTYVMSLKDQAGLVKMLAMVSVQDYSVVGVGNNIEEAVRTYKAALNSTGNNLAPAEKAQRTTVSGKILRISADVNNGTSYYYMLLEGQGNKVFVATSAVSHELPLSREGDAVTVVFDNTTDAIVDIAKFDNSALGTASPAVK